MGNISSIIYDYTINICAKKNAKPVAKPGEAAAKAPRKPKKHKKTKESKESDESKILVILP